MSGDPARGLDRARAPGENEVMSTSVTPVYLALRKALRGYIARRVRPEHVDDVVQDVMMRMHEHAAELREEARLPAWAFRIAQAVVADHHRARGKEPSIPGRDADDPADQLEATAEEDGNVNTVVAGWLGPMLALLPDEYQEAVQRVDVEGLTHKAYAERAGLSVSGAKSRVQRGRRMLEEVVRACCDLEVDARGNVIGFERRNCRC
jgi:RNA polymerase sigma-70 factor (ECF subfamily)